MKYRKYDHKRDKKAAQRMWLRMRPATSLAITDQLSAPQELLEKLDWILRLPEPKLDWSF